MDEALRTFERARGHGDLTAHAAIKAYRERRGLPPEIDPRLVGYDWDQAFAVVGDGLEVTLEEGKVRADGGRAVRKHCATDLRPAREAAVDLSPFDRRDVRRVVALSEGSHDSEDWLALLELWDGRAVLLRAGCDYTGWD